MSSRKRDGVCEVDTTPPPAGETDAYSAPTKVAPLSASVYESLLQQYEGSSESRPIVKMDQDELEELELEEVIEEPQIAVGAKAGVSISKPPPGMLVAAVAGPSMLIAQAPIARPARLQWVAAASLLATMATFVVWFLRTHH